MKISDRRAYWSGVLSEQASSGESIAGFCRRRELSQASFYAWRKRLGESEASAFVPVSVLDLAQIEFDLPGGVKMRLPRDREVLRTVFDVLFEMERGA